MSLSRLITFLITISFYTVFSQNHKSQIDFNYIEILDENWSKIKYEGTFKSRNLKVPLCQLQENNTPENNLVDSIIRQEVKSQIKRMFEIYGNDGMKQNTSFKQVSKNSYEYENIRAIITRHQIQFSFMTMTTILIINDEEMQIYSVFNKEGLDVSISCVTIEKKLPVVYGLTDATPSSGYGGPFKIIFDGNKRIIKYSYYQKLQHVAPR